MGERVRDYGCDSVRAAAEYFSKACAPGAHSAQYQIRNQDDYWEYSHLCDLCHGTAGHYCERNYMEDYYGHTGAFRCLVEGGGQVACFHQPFQIRPTILWPEGARRVHFFDVLLTTTLRRSHLPGRNSTVGGYSGAEQTLRPVPRQRVPNGLLYRRVQVRVVDSKANAIDFDFYSGCYLTFIMIKRICQNAQNKCYFY